MDTSRLLRAIVSLLIVAAFAIVFGGVLRLVFSAAGTTTATATRLSIPVSVAVALALSDAYTPLGRGPVPGLKDRPTAELVLDIVLTAVVAIAVAGVFVVLGRVGPAVLGTEIVAIVAGIVGGYGFFYYRNIEHYQANKPDQP